jgi:hypothetical protein
VPSKPAGRADRTSVLLGFTLQNMTVCYYITPSACLAFNGRTIGGRLRGELVTVGRVSISSSASAVDGLMKAESPDPPMGAKCVGL